MLYLYFFRRSHLKTPNTILLLLIYKGHCLCQDKSFSLSMEDLERRFMVLSEGNTWMIVLPPHHPRALSPITPHIVKSPNSLGSNTPTSFDLQFSFSYLARFSPIFPYCYFGESTHPCGSVSLALFLMFLA